jgi:hypothetical protein
MPSNLDVSSLVVKNNINNEEQIQYTIKYMMCSKKINSIIEQLVKSNDYCKTIFVIENYIMPDFAGKNQLKFVSALISLQALVRQYIIQIGTYQLNGQFKLYTPTPSENKLVFSGKGNADKEYMVETFFEYYDGVKLLPTCNAESDVHKINDIVDAFSLVCYGFKKYIED